MLSTQEEGFPLRSELGLTWFLYIRSEDALDDEVEFCSPISFCRNKNKGHYGEIRG